VEFEPVTPGSAPLPAEAASELARRWEKAKQAAPAPALATFETPAPLLPSWTWPMADPDDPTPIYDELVQTMPDPCGEVNGHGVADPAGPDQRCPAGRGCCPASGCVSSPT
jgi:hypothetical protein